MTEAANEALPVPSINAYADVVVKPDRIAFEGPWAFFIPEGMDATLPITQTFVSLLMVEWAISQLMAVREKFETQLSLRPAVDVVGEVWTPEKQREWEAMTPEQRHAALVALTRG